LRIERNGVPSQYGIFNYNGGGYNYIAVNTTTGEPAYNWLTSVNGTSNTTRMTLNGASYMLDVTGSVRGTTSAYFSTASGNVGIGTTSANKLGADKALTINGATDSLLELTVGDVRKLQMYHGGTNAQLNNLAAGSLTLITNGISALTLASTGAATFSGAGSFTGNALSLSGNNPNFSISTTTPNLYCYIGFAAGTADGSIFQLGNTYASTGPYLASSIVVGSNGIGGLSLNAAHASGAVRLYSGGATERLRVGQIGFTASIIDASDANSKIFLNDLNTSAGLIPTLSGSTFYFYGRSSSTNYRYTAAGSTYFTGQHGNKPIDMDLKTNIKNYIGLIVSSVGSYYSVNPITNEITTGVDAIQISEALPEIKLTDKDEDKSVWGVVTNVKNDNYNTDGTIEIDNDAQFGDRLGENVIRVNGLGEGAIWVTNINGNIENGDYVCSSIIAGYGKKQNDDLLHNYSVAKSTMDCDFDLNNEGLYLCEEFEFNGETYKKAFIGCTYHCG